MAISFANAPGNFFNSIGKLGLLLSQVRTYQAAQLTNMTNTTAGVVAQYTNESDIQAVMGQNYITNLNSAGSLVGNLAANIADLTANRVVYRDNPQQNQTLQSTNTLASLQEIIRQMKVQGATVLAQTVAASPGTFLGTGNGVLVTSTRRPLDGLVLENLFAETIVVACSNDSYVGGATAGNESFDVTGTGSASLFDFNWPLGSNANTSLSAIDGDTSNNSGNLLNNSGFTTFTSNVPNRWSLVVGTAGTDVFSEDTLVYGTGKALRILGDGSTLVSLTQTFDSSSGTTDALDSITQYSVNIFARRDGTAPAAGVLTIDLIDGSNNVINDANGTANSFTIDLTALSTSYAAFNSAFRTPYVLPSTIKIRMRLTTALTTGRSVYLDKLSLGEMTQLYTGGLYAAVPAGANPFVDGDYALITCTNSRGSGGTLNSFQTLMHRLFPDVVNSELLIPSASSPRVNDALIG